MQLRIAKRTALQRLVVSGCALTLVGSLGCKTGMSVPGASMLGFKKTPSAETLAGQGPTTTYPVTPGNNFTPNAIASKTAGTGETNSSLPQGAAAANGYASSGSDTKAQTPPSYAASGWGGTPATTATNDSTKAPAPSYATSTPNDATKTPSYATPSADSIPNYGTTSPSYAASGTGGTYSQPGNYTQPSTYAQPNSYAQSSTYAQPSGYEAPTASAPSGNYTPPSSDYASSPYGNGSTSTNPYAATSAGSDYAPSNPTTYPDPQQARVAGGFALPPSSTAPTSGQSQAGTNDSSTAPATYRPGSTAGATAYPDTPYSTPNGSMLR